jgi:hypothetical protein
MKKSAASLDTRIDQAAGKEKGKQKKEKKSIYPSYYIG